MKTAAFGGDPNPGRILQAAGASGVAFDADALDVRIGDAVVADAGVIPAAYFEPASELADQARRQMKDAEIPVAISIGDGPGRARRLRLRSVLRVRPDQRGVHDLMNGERPSDLAPQIRQRTVAKAHTLLEALPFMREHHGKVIVVKYGGAAMDRTGLAGSFAQDVSLLQSAGHHGGGRPRRAARR